MVAKIWCSAKHEGRIIEESHDAVGHFSSSSLVVIPMTFSFSHHAPPLLQWLLQQEKNLALALVQRVAAHRGHELFVLPSVTGDRSSDLLQCSSTDSHLYHNLTVRPFFSHSKVDSGVNYLSPLFFFPNCKMLHSSAIVVVFFCWPSRRRNA